MKLRTVALDDRIARARVESLVGSEQLDSLEQGDPVGDHRDHA